MKNKKIIEKIEILKSILIARATGRPASNERYIALRNEILEIKEIKDELPLFLTHCEDLVAFWHFIQPQSPTYRGRREYLHNAFKTVLSVIESIDITEMKEMPSVFLAHSSSDKFFVRRLAEELRKSGVKIWIDEAEIKVGDSLTQKIGQAISETDYFGVVLSFNSISSEWVQKELQIALQKEIEEGRVIILPILMEPVEIPLFLRDKLYADFTTPDKFEQSVKKIVESLGIKIQEQPKLEIEEKSIPITVDDPGSILMGFDDIRIIGIDAERTYRPDPSKELFNIYLNLSSSPPREWQDIFNAERKFPRHTMWRRAWIEDRNIVIHCVPEEVEKYHLQDLKEDVKTSNEKYRQYLGEITEQKARQERKEKQEKERITYLKRKLKFE